MRDANHQTVNRFQTRRHRDGARDRPAFGSLAVDLEPFALTNRDATADCYTAAC